MTTRHFVRLILSSIFPLTLLLPAYAGTPGPCTGTPPACTTYCGKGCTWTVAQDGDGAYVTAKDTANHSFRIFQSTGYMCVDRGITVNFQRATGVTDFTLSFGASSVFGNSTITPLTPSPTSRAGCSVLKIETSGSAGTKTLDPKVVVSGSQPPPAAKDKSPKK